MKISTSDIFRVVPKIERLGEVLAKSMQRDQNGMIVMTNAEAEEIGNLIVELAKSFEKNQ